MWKTFKITPLDSIAPEISLSKPIIILLLACTIVCPQESEREFEVATVKVSREVRGAYMAGGPGSSNQNRFTFVHASIGALLRRAFALQSFQISAPGGLPTEFYDVNAKVPAGATEVDFEEMLRNLLVKRFSIQFHREDRDLKGYELLAAKRGVRLKTAEIPAVPVEVDTPVGELKMVKDRSGEEQLPPGHKARLVIPLPDGRVRYSGRMQSMSDIVEMCIRELHMPVVDRAALPGLFDFNIDFMRTPDDPAERAGNSDSPFIVAFQSQLGLRLEAKKVRMSILIIDHIEKVPSEN